MKKLENTIKEKERAFLLGAIFDNRENINSQLDELERLAETAGLLVVGRTHQYIREITPATLFGKGKLEEIKTEIESLEVEVVIVDYEISGSQMKNLTEVLGVKVLDRIGLILDIFAMRATTIEGKLQVELAQLKYSLPRLSSLSGTSGRFGSGGIGMRGPGETKLELDRRVIDDKIFRLSKEIAKIKDQRFLKRKNRQYISKKKIAIVGYTNAGKSSFLNLITKAGIYADDKLFATLETTSRNVWLSSDLQIILTDTVGFISKLPHSLVDAFASTLEEASDADLILHIVDISNKDYQKQMEVVNTTLKQIKADNIPIIVVYNKIDNLGATPFIKLKENEVLVSVKKNQGIEELKQKLIEKLS
ncbi:MAG: GTPase HflX [Clostridia bacterium]|nr:GTPase HflX [Clostridia bacterium]